MRQSIWLASVIAIAAACVTGRQARADVILENRSSGTAVGYGGGYSSGAFPLGTQASPGTVTEGTVATGSDGASTSYAWDPTSGLTVSMQHSRTGESGYQSISSGSIDFHPTDSTTTFSIFDSYTFTNVTGGEADMWVKINAVPTGTNPSSSGIYAEDYYHFEDDGSGATVEFEPGSIGEKKQSSGSLSNTLDPKFDYEFSWEADIQNLSSRTDGGATASGSLGIKFFDSPTTSSSDSTAAPLPTSALAGCALLLGLALQRLRTRRAVENV